MPFLQKEKRPNFFMDENNEWILDAKEQLDVLIQENLKGP
jgi:hypothetical protein